MKSQSMLFSLLWSRTEKLVPQLLMFLCAPAVSALAALARDFSLLETD